MLCCQRKADSCSLMEGSLFVLQTFVIDEYNARSQCILSREERVRPLDVFGKRRSTFFGACDCLKMLEQSAHGWCVCKNMVYERVGQPVIYLKGAQSPSV